MSQITRLRRQLVVLYGLVIGGAVATLDRAARRVATTDRSRFLLGWLGLFVASLLAVLLGRRIRARLAELVARLPH